MRDGDSRFATVFDEFYPQIQCDSHVVGTRDFSVMHVQQVGHEKFIPPVSDIVFRLVLDGPLEHSSVRYDSGDIELSGRKGAFFVAPAHDGAEWRSEGEHELLMLAVSERHVRELMSLEGTGEDADPLRSLYRREIFNAALPQYLTSIWREGHENGRGASLMVDGLFMTLLGTLDRIAGEGCLDAQTADGAGLDSKRLARVIDFIDANLSRPIVTRELADIAALSPFHFSRCFRISTNTSPHKFVTERRIEVAKCMLADASLTLAQIAYDCGFSNQSHFTKAFKECAGVTPGAYRAAL